MIQVHVLKVAKIILNINMNLTESVIKNVWMDIFLMIIIKDVNAS